MIMEGTLLPLLHGGVPRTIRVCASARTRPRGAALEGRDQRPWSG